MMISQRLSRHARTMPSPRLVLAAALCLGLCSCGSTPQGPPRKATVPVKGQVLVNGNPAAELAVALHDVKGIDKQSPTFPKAITDPEGKFQIYTYEPGDGAPEGEYVVTFLWGQKGPTGAYGGPDKLRGRFSKPANATQRVTVKKGEPIDMGAIQLSSQ